MPRAGKKKKPTGPPKISATGATIPIDRSLSVQIGERIGAGGFGVIYKGESFHLRLSLSHNMRVSPLILPFQPLFYSLTHTPSLTPSLSLTHSLLHSHSRTHSFTHILMRARLRLVGKRSVKGRAAGPVVIKMVGGIKLSWPGLHLCHAQLLSHPQRSVHSFLLTHSGSRSHDTVAPNRSTHTAAAFSRR